MKDKNKPLLIFSVALNILFLLFLIYAVPRVSQECDGNANGACQSCATGTRPGQATGQAQDPAQNPASTPNQSQNSDFSPTSPANINPAGGSVGQIQDGTDALKSLKPPF